MGPDMAIAAAADIDISIHTEEGGGGGGDAEDGAATGEGGPCSCSCSNIAIMQLFHELKQQFPTVPDGVVSETIARHCHDRKECAVTLSRLASRYSLAAYPYPPPDPLSPCTLSRCTHTHTGLPPHRRPGPSGDRDRDPAPGSPYPVDVSVNLKGNRASVNLTVTTPPMGRARAFSAHSHPRSDGSTVRITVSPAPSASGHPHPRERRPRSEEIPEVEFATPLDSLVWRQKIRLERLERALSAERARLTSMEREVRGLRIPVPASAARLRPAVRRLRILCQRLARRLDRVSADESFYDNIYTGQEIASDADGDGDCDGDGERDREGSWRCRVCTFRNHGLLNECEECDMPRIILVHADEGITFRVVPGRGKYVRSWIL